MKYFKVLCIFVNKMALKFLQKTKLFFTEKRMTTFIMLVLISWMSIWFLRFSKNYPHGDSIDYILMTEAIYNHGTPNITKKDITNYIDFLEGMNIRVEKKMVYDDLLVFHREIETDSLLFNPNKIQSKWAFILGKGEKVYTQHFWFYSVLAIPARAFLELIDGDFTKTFLITNLTLLFLAIWLVLKNKKLNYPKRLVIATLMGFSPAVWYMYWPHVELFAGVYTLLAIVYFFTDKKIRSVFILSILSLHYPPLAFLALFIIGNILYEKRGKWNIKLFKKLFIAAVWVFIPTIFSLLVFGVPNIITAQDYLSWELVSFHRFFWFFFDPNQGVILAIPLFIFVFIGFAVYDSIKRQNGIYYYLASSIVVMALFFMQMKNWNHDGEITNRYAVWIASLIVGLVIFRTFKMQSKLWMSILIVLLVASQIAVISSQAEYKKIRYSALMLHPIGEYVLINYPDLYNPDPLILSQRLNDFAYSSTDSVKVVADHQNNIKKMMVYLPAYRQLIQRGMDSLKVMDFIEHAKKFDAYGQKWFYVNESDFEKLGYNQSKDTMIAFIEKSKRKKTYQKIKRNILSSQEWQDNIKKQAKEWGISYEEALHSNIEHIINENKK
ncbi:MAG: hypothetical protein CMC96_12495 [Flavobacteriales bacterium]|nr:hypothetical protein [Flavobacteriales bacterium]|tara:strand:+ start:19556 stop:21382 length:1827 start_codon:yes stop_codon:yes gene_type:complete